MSLTYPYDSEAMFYPTTILFFSVLFGIILTGEEYGFYINGN